MPILETAIARFRHYDDLKEELKKTKTELADRKEIDKAKGLLMDKKRISEPEAYQLLRNTAMTQNKRLIDIARSINSTAELLFG